jgi:hypothetical protein
LRNSWIKMNYEDALASMRKHFNETIGAFFTPKELDTVKKNLFLTPVVVVGYATVTPRLQSQQPTKKKKF